MRKYKLQDTKWHVSILPGNLPCQQRLMPRADAPCTAVRQWQLVEMWLQPDFGLARVTGGVLSARCPVWDDTKQS